MAYCTFHRIWADDGGILLYDCLARSGSESASSSGKTETRVIMPYRDPYKGLEYQKEYRAKNHEILCAKMRAKYWSMSLEERKKFKREEYQVYKESNRLRARLKRGRHRQEALDVYGRECLCCGETNPIFLTFDHINNDGKAHRDALGYQVKSRPHLRYCTPTDKIIIDLKSRGWPKDVVQVLCMNCNFARHRAGSCPHGISVFRSSTN